MCDVAFDSRSHSLNFVKENMFKVPGGQYLFDDERIKFSGGWLLFDENYNIEFGKWYCLQCNNCFAHPHKSYKHMLSCADEHLVYIYGPNESGAFAPEYYWKFINRKQTTANTITSEQKESEPN